MILHDIQSESGGKIRHKKDAINKSFSRLNIGFDGNL
jgi:hypothetical protein